MDTDFASETFLLQGHSPRLGRIVQYVFQNTGLNDQASTVTRSAH